MTRSVLIQVVFAGWLLLGVVPSRAAGPPPPSAPPAPKTPPEPAPEPASGSTKDAPVQDAPAPARDASAKAPAAIKFAPPGPLPIVSIPQDGQVTVLKIDDMIDLGLSPFVQRVVDGLGQQDLFILDVNTLGGRVDAAIVIRDAVLNAKARTVCWIHPRAISAGALICLAADVIVVAPGASIGAATPIQLGQDGSAKPVEEKMTSYMRTEMGTTAEAKGRRGIIAEAMVDMDIEIEGLSPKGKLLTLDGEKALTWGIASAEAADEAALFKALGRAEPAQISRPTMSWAERLARFLSDPTVSGLLMTLGMLGILIELYSGGTGVGLIVGLSCLGLFFFGHHVVKLAGIEEILLLLLGLVLVGIEIFVPGHLVPGIVGVLCIVAALVLSLVNLEHVPFQVAWEFGWLRSALARVVLSLVVTGALAIAAAKFMPRTRLGRSVVLDAALTSTAIDPLYEGLKALEGQTVTVATDLKPSGKVLAGGRRVEAMSERGYVAAGARVRILRADGYRLIVREVGDGDASPAGAASADEDGTS